MYVGQKLVAEMATEGTLAPNDCDLQAGSRPPIVIETHELRHSNAHFAPGHSETPNSRARAPHVQETTYPTHNLHPHAKPRGDTKPRPCLRTATCSGAYALGGVNEDGRGRPAGTRADTEGCAIRFQEAIREESAPPMTHMSPLATQSHKMMVALTCPTVWYAGPKSSRRNTKCGRIGGCAHRTTQARKTHARADA